MEAAALFDAVATNHSSHEVAPYAAQLALESMNQLRTDACFELIGVLADRYHAAQCVQKPRDEEYCSMLEKIRVSAARLRAERRVKEADATRGERARGLYLTAGRMYFELWTEQLASACEAKSSERCARSEEVLYNAARAFFAARDVVRGVGVLKVLMNPKFNLHQTELGRRALFDVGSAFQALGEYALARDHYERFGEADPKSERAPTALSDAVVLSLGLGELERAEKIATTAERLYGGKQKKVVAQIWFAIADTHVTAGSFAQAARIARVHQAQMLKELPERRIQIEVLAATALAGSGKSKQADEAWDRASKLKPEVPTSSGDDMRLLVLGKELVALGKARLAVADRSAKAALKITLKRGAKVSGNHDTLEKKLAAIAEAEKLYMAVLSIQPEPPPMQTAVAAARVARLKSQLWAQVHVALGETEAEPHYAAAKAAHRKCVELGAKLEVLHEDVAACAAWLRKHFPRELVPVTELVPKLLGSSQFAAPPPPLDGDGEVYIPL